MKKILNWVVLTFLALCLFSCQQHDVPVNNDSTNSTVVEKTVSVYDEIYNPITSFAATEKDNVIDVSQYEKYGYDFLGLYTIDGDVMLFNPNGYQSPMVLIDRDYNVVPKYAGKEYTIVFNESEGQMVEPSKALLKVCYGDDLFGFFPDMSKGEEYTFDGWFDDNNKRYTTGTVAIYEKLTQDYYDTSDTTINLFRKRVI